MSLFWHRQRNIQEDEVYDIETSSEVKMLKNKAHKSAVQADRDIRKLNDLLRADGITLKIHIATGGRHG